MRAVKRTAILCLVGVLATLSLTGCALLGIASPGLYDHVDSLAKKLDLSSVGTVQYQGHYGLGWQADIPTYIAIVSGPDASDQIAGELNGLGFTIEGEKTDGSWSRGDGDSYYQVVVREVAAGDEVYVGKQRVRVKQAGVAVSIR